MVLNHLKESNAYGAVSGWTTEIDLRILIERNGAVRGRAFDSHMITARRNIDVAVCDALALLTFPYGVPTGRVQMVCKNGSKCWRHVLHDEYRQVCFFAQFRQNGLQRLRAACRTGHHNDLWFCPPGWRLAQ